jgi:ABC-type lipoprotein export system ATPase subunit
MQKIKVDLKHCYGIKTLKHTFDFSDRSAYAVYAPNGAMKSSFAQVFKDIAEGNDSSDRIFTTRASSRAVTDDAGQALPRDAVMVIRPYAEEFGHSEKTSTLLVNAALRKEYEQLHVETDKVKDRLLKALKKQSGSKADIEREISLAFTASEDQFYRVLLRIKHELEGQGDAPLADVKYDVILDDKVQAFLDTPDAKGAIESYILKYNELLAASTYFRRGTFNYYNASSVAKSLADNGFFSAKHTVSLNAGTSMQITSERELADLIAKEKEAISTDAALRERFAAIEKLITKNANLRQFEEYISTNGHLLPKLANRAQLKEELWKSYLKTHYAVYEELLECYAATDKRKKEIEEEAARERTQWEQVIDIFNSRFFVPFKLTAKNRVSVILGDEPMLTLSFSFTDGDEEVAVEKAALMKALSTGEKKALYILNIIFEVEARKQQQQPTVFIVDDIADSFDYRNKYAIIQYLREIAEEPYFRQILLTHNFDFFRTVCTRFVGYPGCLMASKGLDGITLRQASGVQNVFVNDWKKHFFADAKKRIASIPFMRNLIEYTKGDTDTDYLSLTALLHWKGETAKLSQQDLDAIYHRLFSGEKQVQKWAQAAELIVNSIGTEVLTCHTAHDGPNFENKIVLSIAIRLAAEQFMIAGLDDPTFVQAINANQTHVLFDRFRSKCAGETAAIETLQRVIIMTPENLHLNSFMYEPILDMSDEHLRKLHTDIVALGNIPNPKAWALSSRGGAGSH